MGLEKSVGKKQESPPIGEDERNTARNLSLPFQMCQYFLWRLLRNRRLNIAKNLHTIAICGRPEATGEDISYLNVNPISSHQLIDFELAG